MSAVCAHASRAIGPHFERCLLCGSWRLHFYGVLRTTLTPQWWPAERPMPSADPFEDSGTEFEDFQGMAGERIALVMADPMNFYARLGGFQGQEY